MSSNLTNYHCHCVYCDGRARMEEFVRFALGRGFSSMGFSSHAPLPFPTPWTMEWDEMEGYLEEFGYLKRKYGEVIELYVGLEIDYLNEVSNPAAEVFQKLPLDYRIGSVHLLYDDRGELVDVDTTRWRFYDLVDEHFEGDLSKVLYQYFMRTMRMLDGGGLTMVGHLDKIRYNANCFRKGVVDEGWYDDLVMFCLEKVAQKGYLLEVNTKAYGETGMFFPDVRYFKRMHDLGIRVVVNSDAHYPDLINNHRASALYALWQVGYRTVMELHGGRWTEVSIFV